MRYSEPHFWTQSEGMHVGTVQLQMSAAVGEQQLLKKSCAMLRGAQVKHVTVQIEPDQQQTNGTQAPPCTTAAAAAVASSC